MCRHLVSISCCAGRVEFALPFHCRSKVSHQEWYKAKKGLLRHHETRKSGNASYFLKRGDRRRLSCFQNGDLVRGSILRLHQSFKKRGFRSSFPCGYRTRNEGNQPTLSVADRQNMYPPVLSMTAMEVRARSFSSSSLTNRLFAKTFVWQTSFSNSRHQVERDEDVWSLRKSFCCRSRKRVCEEMKKRANRWWRREVKSESFDGHAEERRNQQRWELVDNWLEN